jgi:hypothetical protein
MQEQEQFTEIALESGTYESRVTKKFTLGSRSKRPTRA